MGFRDLECFNQALLAKQAWKLVNNPNCLMAAFLKSRYFPHTNFLEAGPGARPSFAWRSILHGRELLEKGLKRVVGDGSKTRVWLDKWVEDPVLGMRAPWRKNTTFNVNLMAKELIDVQSRKWNTAVLKETFVAADVEMILAHQPSISHEDSHTWRFNRSGNMTVKSAYWLARNQKIKEIFPEVLASPSLNPIKEKAWKVKTAPKIRTFLWKALSEALPVADLIIKRGMKIDDTCQLCGMERETILHTLFLCDPARQPWALSGISFPASAFTEGPLFANFSYLMNLKGSSSGLEEDKRAWPWVIWCIWKSINDLTFKGRRWDPEEIIVKAKEESNEWFLAQQVEDEVKIEDDRIATCTKKRWTPPKEGWLMCNVGFDWDQKKNLLGVAWIVRNHRGWFSLTVGGLSLR